MNNLQAENNLANIFTKIKTNFKINSNRKSKILIYNKEIQIFPLFSQILTNLLHILIICKKKDNHLQISNKIQKTMILKVINKNI